MLNLATLYRVESKAERAEPLLRKAAKIYSDTGDPRLAGALSEMGLIALRRGKYAIAETNLTQALDMLTKAFDPEHVSVGLVEASLAEVYLKERDYSNAELFIRRALEKERRFLDDASFEVAKSFLIAAQIEEKQNRRSEADTDYRKAIALYGNVIGDDHPEALHARELYSRFAKTARGQVRNLPSSDLKPGSPTPR
jgi:tetratricopeptide (TPR) repeat protein